ncbi:UNVERIFIED_CONTAM: cytochrome c [Halobacillus marinus]|uniref:cytochrome c551 n=1 Tax=Bacillaceae TaxID=186817 RepID=UPI0002A4F023|nr:MULTISPECIES: cytochrome c [Bacillaceae]ELK47075.1 cytochrome C class I [Halobacillus sp. BAB-2008]QHT47665.1 cytochrome c [Bacillus sp. SB49]
MEKWWLVLCLGLVLVLAACGGGQEDGTQDDTGSDEQTEEDAGADSNGDASAAEAVYQANCTNCHGGNLEGGFGPSLTTIGSKYSADEIKEIILNGRGSMPQQDVSEEDADLVANWLSTMEE